MTGTLAIRPNALDEALAAPGTMTSTNSGITVITADGGAVGGLDHLTHSPGSPAAARPSAHAGGDGPVGVRASCCRRAGWRRCPT